MIAQAVEDRLESTCPECTGFAYPPREEVGGVVVSGILNRLEVRDDHALVELTGVLRLGTMADVRRLLIKLLADHERLLIDLSRIRLEWEPAVQVFPSVLTDAGGWPAARLVLFGADDWMSSNLRALHVQRTVPVVRTRADAERRVLERPDRVTRARELPAHSGAPRAARMFLSDVCLDWGAVDLYEDAALVASELVTNAVVHAESTSRLRIGLDHRGLWLEVRDYRPGDAPRPRPRVIGGNGGRGLHVVDAVAQQWGVTDHPDGKTVWALLRVRSG
ncbi:ATP-binding protein [Pseudonocardia alaniniphila]|uniref:ATP-binding protein n=1 Tax=Pseudonocardia alaniniphila TaxID=75291 RepID=A0ABS9TH65_9PSEU|nr:ATP-binding protein [Pseudonocardia alaniniphila]MCH6167823.1 ATP-binding protein [Pseudonocardia alaniniphila]